MNRRSYLKSAFAIFGTSAVAISTYEWWRPIKSFEFSELEAKHDILAEIVDTIIPPTLTPGAKACGVHKYIIKVLKSCYSVKQQDRFLTGMQDLETYAVEEFGVPFVECNVVERSAVLEHLMAKIGSDFPLIKKIRRKILGEPFFTILRNLTVEGYCVSKYGATQGLAYDYIPGTYEGCIPLKQNQKSWATK